jgi:two-component system CheB/CheR fusion protein
MSTQKKKQKSAVGEQAKTSQVKVNNQFPIVGIGASAGGLDPIRKLLENLPTDTGMAFVVIQHLATGQESMLPEILSRATQMCVLQVKDGMKVDKNQVYVITPGTTMTLKNGFLKLVPKGVALKPINDFFISLASERKALSIGIVLSGTGNDGTEGLKAIKAEGGITFVQDPETAQYADMPRNAIDAETAYFVLSPENIVKEIVRIIKNPQLTRTETVAPAPEQAKTETPLKKILSMLKTAFGVDFTHYKETTINRRITRRMVINKIENEKEYVPFLRANPNELGALFDDLLIGVTSFFREPKTFEALKEKVFPELIKNRSTNENIRVWVPGCSTGEEVYSLAIAIQEFLEEKALANLRVQIFGTDANVKNIEKARLGLYPKTIEDHVSESRLKRFFTRQNGNYQIIKLIREMCIFAKQDITSDPPFSNLDFIICRNVLIYFDSLLHERVFPIFHYGLKDNGFLIIGESESIGKFSYLFEPVTNKGLIFRKKRAQPQGTLHLETFASYSPAKKNSKQLEKPNFLVSLKEEVDSLLIAEYAPASLLVNNNLEILVFRGQVNPYLTHEPGTASLNVAKIVQKELRTDVQTIIYRARKENKAFKDTIQFKHDGQQKKLTIKVNPLKIVDFDEPFFLVTFQEESSPRKLSPQEAESKTTSVEKESAEYKQVQELKADLESTKQSLQTIIEVQEATNEELRSTMEEAQSSNEELQSTNEELETAKEELQSSNEELQTLNEELQNRNLALGRLNDDLANFQANMDVPVVIVDNDLKIRRFTESALDFLKISPSDVGRLITGIKLAVHIENLEQTILDVISKLRVVTQEIEYDENRWCEMRVRPYLTADKKIDGAVISLVDVTEHKKTEQEISNALKKSQRSESEISALLRASRAVLQNKEFKDSARAIFDACKELIGATAGYVALLSDDGKENLVLFLDSGGLPCTVDPSLPMPIRGLRGEVYNSGKAVFENIFPRSEWQKFSPKGHVQLQNVLFAPLTVENSVVGVIGLANKTGGFTKRDAEMAVAFGELASIALVNSQMLDKLEENEKELRMHSKHLEVLVEERTRQLKDSERLSAIGATAGMVGHDIRNPLQAITSDVYLVKTELASTPESEEKKNALESLREIEKNTDYINKIVQDLQDFAKPLTPHVEESDLKLIIDELITKNGLPENIKVSVNVEPAATNFVADSTFINRIMYNLVNNAVQAMPNGGRLTIHAYKETKDIVITVEDTGVGIPEQVKGKLFTPMFTTKAKGQGFGLAVIKRMSEALGGTVTFESQEGKGTTFTVRLPPPKELNGKWLFK